MSFASERAKKYLEACQSQDIHSQDVSFGKVAVVGTGKVAVNAQRRQLFCNVLRELEVIEPVDSIVVLLNTLSVAVARRQAEAGSLHGKDRWNLQCRVNRQIGHLAEEVFKTMESLHGGSNAADELALQLAQFSEAAFQELRHTVDILKATPAKLAVSLESDTAFFNHTYEEKVALAGDFGTVKHTLKKQRQLAEQHERTTQAASAIHSVNLPLPQCAQSRSGGVYRPSMQQHTGRANQVFGTVNVGKYCGTLEAPMDAAIDA